MGLGFAAIENVLKVNGEKVNVYSSSEEAEAAKTNLQIGKTVYLSSPEEKVSYSLVSEDVTGSITVDDDRKEITVSSTAAIGGDAVVEISYGTDSKAYVCFTVVAADSTVELPITLFNAAIALS